MTKSKDPLPEADTLPEAPPAADAAAQPFVEADPVDPPLAEPALPKPPEPAPQVIVRRGSFVAPLLGGAVAAIGGFALSHFDVLNLRTDAAAELAALSSQVAELQSNASGADTLGPDLAALSDRVARLESAPAPELPDLSRLDMLDQRLAAIEAMPTDGTASAAALTAKLAELERRIADQPQGASPELQQKLDAALARLDEAEAAATARAEEAEAAATAAERVRALDALSGRIAAGEPFAAELQALNDPSATAALSAFADSGAPTLSDLQASFPEAARQALRVARETSPDTGWGDRFVDFLASQTGARSLTPLEGDTPDAILSRADFALSEGRVADAVSELQALEARVKAALEPWLVQAQAHLAASAALQAARGE